MKKRYPRTKKGIAGKTVQLPLFPYSVFFVCCSCGRAHRHQYRIIEQKKNGAVLFYRNFDDNVLTQLERRKMVREKRLHTLDKRGYLAYFEKGKLP